jgi:hypothetical protein
LLRSAGRPAGREEEPGFVEAIDADAIAPGTVAASSAALARGYGLAWIWNQL